MCYGPLWVRQELADLPSVAPLVGVNCALAPVKTRDTILFLIQGMC